MSSNFRKNRLASQIVRETSLILLREMSDPRLGFVTVTRSKISDDLSYAVIYVTILGTKKKKKLSLSGLKSAQGFVQRELTRRIQMRSFPEIRFEIDEQMEKMYEINGMLDGIARQRKTAEAAKAAEAPQAVEEEKPGAGEEE